MSQNLSNAGGTQPHLKKHLARMMLEKTSDIPFGLDPSQKLMPWLMGLLTFLVILPVLCATAMGDVLVQAGAYEPAQAFVMLMMGGSVILAAILGLAAILSIVFMTYSGLTLHRKSIQVLHLVGATNDYIAQQFQKHVFNMGLKGAVIGVVLAIATICGFDILFSSPASTVYSQVQLSFVKTISILLLTPALVLLLVMTAARLTVKSVLGVAMSYEAEAI